MGGLAPLGGISVPPPSAHLQPHHQQQQQRQHEEEAEPETFEDLEAELDAALGHGGGGAASARNSFSSKPPLGGMGGARISTGSAASVDLGAYDANSGGFINGGGGGGSRNSRYGSGRGGGSPRPDSPMFPSQGRLSSAGSSRGGGGGGLQRLKTPRMSSGNSGPVGMIRRLSSGGGGSGRGSPQVMSFGVSDSPPMPPGGNNLHHNQHSGVGGGGGGGGYYVNRSLRRVESAGDDDDDFGSMMEDSPMHPEVNKVVFAVELENDSPRGAVVSGGGSSALDASSKQLPQRSKPMLDDLDEDFMTAILEES